MDIIEVKSEKDRDYERYEHLLIKKESLLKDSASILVAYIKEFGELLTESFKEKIECIKLKKQIGYIQAIINKGQTVDIEAISKIVENEMEDYYQELQKMIQDSKSAQESTKSTGATVLKVKRLYREIAKKLHPDINPRTKDDERLSELWYRVCIAYRENNVKTLEELKFLVDKELANGGLGNEKITIPDIKEKITDLENEIDHIVNNDPYRYKDIISDSNLIKEKKAEIIEEIKKYVEYKKSLKDILEELKNEGNEGEAGINWLRN